MPLIDIKTMKNWNKFKNKLQADVSNVNGFRDITITRVGAHTIALDGAPFGIVWDFLGDGHLSLYAKARKYTSNEISLKDLTQLERVLNFHTIILLTDFN